ncbi:glycosyltransferase family 2 protein [Qipengyuania sp. DSG2-2]|uniref:glycosyltransferase family 2 protein n=1 Tax=Qipengyuania sp. DGS2-2 TaxID=3349631 RepID=UPI0036D29484
MTCNAPRFSIVIPVFNAADTICQTVRSVLAQSFQHWELILVDDGSTDRSLHVMRELAGQDSRIRLISQTNAGVSAARNLGAEMARGELLAFLDSDDCWESDKLAIHDMCHQADPAIAASYAMIAFCTVSSSSELKPRVYSSVPSGCLSVAQLVGENPVCSTSNLVVNREAFTAAGGFRRGMQHAEDQEFLARFAAKGGRIQGIDRHLVNYRMSADGLSADLAAMYDGWRILAREYVSPAELPGAEALYCRYLARRALRTGGPAAEALRFAMAGLRLDAGQFLADRKRGGLTLLCAFAGVVMPGAMRRRVFA